MVSAFGLIDGGEVTRKRKCRQAPIPGSGSHFGVDLIFADA